MFTVLTDKEFSKEFNTCVAHLVHFYREINWVRNETDRNPFSVNATCQSMEGMLMSYLYCVCPIFVFLKLPFNYICLLRSLYSRKHLLLIRLCVTFLVSITTGASGYCEQFGWLRGISVKWGREGVMETMKEREGVLWRGVERPIISFHTLRGGGVSDYEELCCCFFIPALPYTLIGHIFGEYIIKKS